MGERPADEDVVKWHRRFGAECNNRAWALAEARVRTPEETQEMLHAAHAAALHWSKVGTPLNMARAQMLLGHVHALTGGGRLALGYATASLAYFASHETPDWEIAFAHAVMAGATRASGEETLYAHHYREAERLGAAIADPDDREIFMRTFREIPAP